MYLSQAVNASTYAYGQPVLQLVQVYKVFCSPAVKLDEAGTASTPGGARSDIPGVTEP